MAKLTLAPLPPEVRAAHEAGHAVVARQQGRNILEVTIVPAADGSHRGCCVLEAWPDGFQPRHGNPEVVRDRARMEDDVVLCCAGRVAVEIASAEWPTLDVKVLEAVEWANNPDMLEMVAICHRLGGIENQRAESERGKQRAASMLRAHWPAVAPLAAALQQNETLGGRVATSIIDAAL